MKVWHEGEMVDGVCCVSCCTRNPLARDAKARGHHAPLRVIEGTFFCSRCGYAYALVAEGALA